MDPLFWLLLPVAAASGWWIARRRPSVSQNAGKYTDLNARYFRGLNYLLNEQPDKAIDVFIQMLEVDGDTVETHLALGNLFRRRGEVDRAIRIHQNLIARPTLDREQRASALLELSHDYMRAGLFDRAESLLQELLDEDKHRRAALKHLLDIYQQEKEWEKAINTARWLENESGKRFNREIAHYYCEQAEEALRHGDQAQAGQLLKKALGHDKTCVRASMLQGRMEKNARNYKAAVRAFKQVSQQDMALLPEVLDELRECYRALGQERQFIDYLQQINAAVQASSATLMQVHLINELEGEEKARDFLIEHLSQRPSVRGLEGLIELQLDTATGKAREHLSILRDLMRELLQEQPKYRCEHCGFAGKTLHWQCPSCKYWSTIKPVQGVAAE